jgi:hypothetical protein
MNGRYLIMTDNGSDPFTTDYWTYENCYNEGDIVIDLYNCKWTRDGINWKELEKDHL